MSSEPLHRNNGMEQLSCTGTGEYEDIEGMDKVVEEINKEKGWHVGIHVDAASGGFIAPFTSPDLKWDFRLKNVTPPLLP